MELTKGHYRAYIFIETKRGISPGQIFKQLQESGEDNYLSERTVERWSKSFKEGRTSLEDSFRCGRPLVSVTEENVTYRENVERISNMIEKNPKLSLRAMADEINKLLIN